MKTYSVYLLSSRKHGTLYLGVTGDLARRVWEHRTGRHRGFTSRHGIKRLVWYEDYENVLAAIEREKKMKKWRRIWKISLIEEHNLDWNDLYPSLFGLTPRQLAAYEGRYPG